MSEVGAISVRITGDNSGFDKAMDDTENRLKRGGRQLRTSINTWAKWGAAATAAAAGVAASLVKMNLNNIRNLRNLANAANMTVAEFQRGSFAAQQFGIEQEKYGDILKDVNDRVGDFLTTGAGPMVDFFEKIAPKVGITADAFKNLSGQDALQLYITSLEKANLNQQEMTFFMEAIASDSTRLLPLFRSNGQAMKTQADAARQLGIGLSQIQVDKAIEAQKSLDRIATIFEGELQKAVADLAPAITFIADKMTDARKDGEGFDVALNAVLPAAKVLLKGVSAIAIGAKTIQLAFHGAAAALSLVIAKIVELGRDINRKVVAPFEKIFTLLNRSGPFAGDFDEIVAGLQNMREGYDQAVIATDEFANAQIDAVSRIKDELMDLATGDFSFEGIDNLFDQMRQRIVKGREEIKKAQGSTGGDAEGTTTPGQSISSGTPTFNPSQFEQETTSLLEMLTFRYQSQEELYLQHLARERQMLNQDLEARRISQSEYDREIIRLTKERERVKAQIVKSNIQSGLKVLATNSKKANKIIQAAAIYNAVVKGKEAAVAAWDAGMSTGGPWAPVVAAAYTAASLAKTGSLISSIKSGGKSQGGGGGGGSVPSTPAANTANTSANGNNQQQPDRTLNVMLAGEGLMSTGQVRGLLGQINEELGNGFRLNVQGG